MKPLTHKPSKEPLFSITISNANNHSLSLSECISLCRMTLPIPQSMQITSLYPSYSSCTVHGYWMSLGFGQQFLNEVCGLLGLNDYNSTSHLVTTTNPSSHIC